MKTHISLYLLRSSLKLSRTTNQRIYLKCGSHNADVTVHIPYDFDGPVTWTNGPRGSTIFSPQVKARLTEFQPEGRRGKAFIARRTTNGRGSSSGSSATRNSSGWSGDALVLGSHSGKINIVYTEEADPMRGQSGRAEMFRILQDIKEEGPVNGVLNLMKRTLSGGGHGGSPQGTAPSHPPPAGLD